MKRCLDCKRLMRPYRAPASEYPDAPVAHAARGMCERCYKRFMADPERHRALTPEMVQLRHENTIAGLNRFMQARYERIIKQRYRSRV